MTGRTRPAARDALAAAAQVIKVHQALGRRRATPSPTLDEILEALATLRWLQKELAATEPALIAAARDRGSSWQSLATALGLASRQAAERRYLRLAQPVGGAEAATRDARVQVERDRRAGDRAADRWANDNSADLRGLAGQITALTDLGPAASPDLGRLHRALGDADATALPALLARTERFLGSYPQLAAQVARVGETVEDVRRATQRRRDRRRDARSRDEPGGRRGAAVRR